MTEVKHTPGPWSVPHFARPEVNCSCGYVLTDNMMGAVCTVYASGEGNSMEGGDNPKFAEAVANAHLIAAAPDLLQACKSALGHMTGNMDGDQDIPGDPVSLMRDAIARAEAA